MANGLFVHGPSQPLVLRALVKLRSLRGQVLEAVATEGALTLGVFISGVW